MTISRAFLLCIFATIVVSIGIYIKFNFSEWSDKVYFDGDNITLALVIKSIVEGQPFRWVFSSQTFLFPEGPLFLVSYFFSVDLKGALLTIAYLNLALLGIPVYLLGRRLLPNAQYGLLGLAMFFSLCSLTLILESTPDINASTIITPFFFATYYSGVIIVSLFELLLISNLVERKDPHRLFLITLFVILGGLTYSSDPLYLLQVIAPLVTVSLILYIHYRCQKESVALAFFLTICSLIAGLMIRHWTSAYTVASVEDYINPTKVGQALTALFLIIAKSINNPFQQFLWFFWPLLFIAHTIYTFKILRKDDATNALNYDARLVHLFCVASPLITLAGVILTGNFYTRYLLPLPMFTMVGFSLMFARIFSARVCFASIFMTLIVTSLCFWTEYTAAPQKPTPNQSDVNCYRSFATRYDLHPVGGYWTSRYLTLYSPGANQVFQVLNDFKPYNWLSNKVDHSNTSINAVIVDHEKKPSLINQVDTEVLGEPTVIYACQQFDIYAYHPSSNGFRILNERIRQ